METQAQTFGRYRIVDKLGEGGMATVYKAFDPLLERYVAIKVIKVTQEMSDKFLVRFQNEARSLAQLSHPNIVRILDYGENNTLPYLVMEYMAGGSLRQAARSALPWQQALQKVIPIARALDYAHQRHIIHRDIKPANILVNDSGEVMLSDFGIAKLVTEETREVTATGTIIGTPDYMAPEQSTGKHVDHRSDIYALGIMLFELITGVKPFQADTPVAVMVKHVNEPLPSLRTLAPDVPTGLEEVVLRATAKNPLERYNSAAEFSADLETLLRGERPQWLKQPGWLTTPIRKKKVEPIVHPPQSKRSPGLRYLIAAASWIGTILLTLGLVMVVLSGIALIAGSYYLSSVANRSLSGLTLHPRFYEVEETISEIEVESYVMNMLQPYTLDAVNNVIVDFISPETIRIKAITNDRTWSIEGKLTLKDGYPRLLLTRLNNIPLIIVGGIISNGINQGVETAMKRENLKLTLLKISGSEIIYTALTQETALPPPLAVQYSFR
ncbi:MAG TPA: protein kinase [Anaerolineaceae bacterium]